jgi:hypothetical protein
MSAIIQDVSPQVLDLARTIQELVTATVKLELAERALSNEPPPPAWIGSKEAARILGVRPRAIYSFVEADRLHPRRRGAKGGRLMFERAEVERVAREQE